MGDGKSPSADLRRYLGATCGPFNPIDVNIAAILPGVVFDVSNRWNRQLGQVDLARVLGAALTPDNPVISGLYDALGNRMPSMDAVARPGFIDVIDRWTRQLGLVDLSRVLGVALSAANPVITGIYDAANNRMPSMDAATRAGYVRSQQNVSFLIRSDKDVNFTTAIAVNAKEDENLAGLQSDKILITNVAILSDEQKYYRVLFYTRDTFDNVNLDLDTFIGQVDLDLNTNGFQIGGTSKWLWSERPGRGNGLEYVDEDASLELHVALQNLGLEPKTAGANGEVVLKISYLPLV